MELIKIKISNRIKFMKVEIRNSFLFAVYQLLLIWFFEVFSFFGNQINALLMYVITLILLFLIQFSVRLIIYKSVEDKFKRRILNAASFIFSSFISSIICWFLFDGNNSVTLIVISSFVIPAILPSVALFLKGIFKENEAVLKNELPKPTKIDEVAVEPQESNEIHFILENESGKVLLNVLIENIICFEANDNYVVTYYLNKQNELKKSMERISLKKIEEILDKLGVTTFSRVHKSYLIHQLFIEEIKGKAQAQKIKLNHLELLIPVSRTFQVSTLKKW
jgi:hypothetical protein